MERKIIQITSGRGPIECCRVVTLVNELILKDCKTLNIESSVAEINPAEIKGTLLSVTLLMKGDDLSRLVNQWKGTVQWIAPSPYRKFHKRKNWFVGVEVFELPRHEKWDLSQVRFETARASGPGGQNVNKVETAVRAIHIPTGVQVLAMDTNSQLQNKKLAIERLEVKLKTTAAEKEMKSRKEQWDEHNSLQRGNPIKTIIAPLL